MRNLLIILSGIIWVWQVTSLASFKILSFSLALNSLITMCPRVGFFEFIKLGVGWASWMPVSMYFIKLGKLSATISSNNFSLSLSLFLLELPKYLCCLTWWYPTDCSGSFHFPSTFFFYSSGSVISTVLSSSCLFLYSAYSNMFLNPPDDFFKFQLFYFSDPEFLFGFLFMLSFHLYFHFVHTSFSWLCPCSISSFSTLNTFYSCFKLCLLSPPSGLSQGHFLLIFFLWKSLTFLLFVCIVIFF